MSENNEVPEVPEVLEVQEVPEVSEVSNVPEVLDVPEVQEVPRVTDMLRTTKKDLTMAEIQMINHLSESKINKNDMEKDDITPIGLYDELDEEYINQAKEEALKNLVKRDDFNQEKNLRKDILTVMNQNYCVVS
jgi:hypothetical protein